MHARNVGNWLIRGRSGNRADRCALLDEGKQVIHDMRAVIEVQPDGVLRARVGAAPAALARLIDDSPTIFQTVHQQSQQKQTASIRS